MTSEKADAAQSLCTPTGARMEIKPDGSLLLSAPRYVVKDKVGRDHRRV